MTRTFVGAAMLAALVSAPLAAQTTPPPSTTTPSSRYRLDGATRTTTPPATKNQTPPTTDQRQVLGPVAPTQRQRTTSDRNVRPAGDEQPIREPGPGQIPPRRPIGGPNPGVQPAADAPPQPPKWFPLNAEQQKWVDDVLAEWERESSKVHRFECTFQRWDFEPVFGPRDGKSPKTFATGVIKYQDPDKGLFRVEKLLQYAPPAKPGEKAKYEPPVDRDADGKEIPVFGEHWVCDGISIFEFDNRQKKLFQRILPKEMQGKAIVDGPLPFLFGAKAAAIKQRYWIRPVEPPAGVKNDYWLEAWPKGRQDAANFKFVTVVIAQNDFMPSGLSVYAPNHDPKTNMPRFDYKFENRKAVLKGDPEILAKLQIWRRDFFEPATPFRWKKVVENLEPVPVANGPQLPPPQARQPKAGVKTK